MNPPVTLTMSTSGVTIVTWDTARAFWVGVCAERAMALEYMASVYWDVPSSAEARARAEKLRHFAQEAL